MNILHLVTGRVPTGAVSSAMTDVRALLEVKQQAWLLFQEGAKVEPACRSMGVPCLTGLKLGRGATRLLNFPRDIRKLRALLREMAIDVLHVHRSDDQLLASAAIGRTLSTRLVRTWHRDPRQLAKPILSRFATQPDGLICVSREHAATLNSMGAKSCQYIPTAVDTKIFSCSDRTITAELRIAHVGRWKRDKNGRDRGQRAVLEIFARLSLKLPWKGFLVGRGETGDALKREAYEDLKLPRSRVELINFQAQSAAEFAKHLGSMDLGLVLATGSDGSSRPAVEMLSCGVPLMVADIPGLREFAEDSSCAIRQLSDDPEGWAHAIERLIQDPKQIQLMRHAARQCAERIHSMKSRGEALINFYRNL